MQSLDSQDAFFLLDSLRLPSLTLRDYSKVVAAHKLSFFKTKSSLECLEVPCRHCEPVGQPLALLLRSFF